MLSLVTAAAIPALSILWALDIHLYFGFEIARTQFLALLFGCGVSHIFSRQAEESFSTVKWLNAIAAIVALAIFSYISIEYQRFLEDFAYTTLEMQILGGLSIVLVLEALRRTTGLILLSIIAVFACYALYGSHIPAPFTATTLLVKELLVYLTFDPNAVFGTPLSVVATIVVVFIFFGKVLVKTGCGEFFIDIAMAGMGNKRGGAAKISIVGSALFGSISGSAVSNVVTTGVMTIPLMKRSGFNAKQSGAIEAIASTGGQLMPPIMGAAAFLMAQSLEVAYSKVVLAALIPAILYYLSVFIQVDLIAARDNVKPVESDSKSIIEILKEGWHFIVPFGILLYSMFFMNNSAAMSALYGTASIAILGFFRSYQGHQLSIKKLLDLMPETGKAVVELIMIVGGAGIVIGLLNISSGGFTLTLWLVQLGSANFLLLLLVSAGVCILLGMGMPTSGVYVLLAALVAPSLIQTGIEPMAAHMFILYFGMMSMITPPIALAAFAAATVSEESPMKTGFEAMRLGWVAYVIPMLFIFIPGLLMNGSSLEIGLAFAIAVVGVYLISVSIVGFFNKKIGVLLRIVLLLVGIIVLLPEQVFQLGYFASFIAAGVGLAVLMNLKHQSKVILQS